MISLTMLDRRIRSIEDIKAFNNIKGSEYKLINEIGYFADNIERFCDLRKLQTGKLTNIVDNKESCFQIVGYFHAPNDTFAVCFGSHEFSLQTLFDYYRWKDSDGNWRVFGVEV